MCTCNICSFHQILNHLKVSENHPEHYNVLDLLEMNTDVINTDSNMLAINSQDYLSKGLQDEKREERLTVYEVKAKEKQNALAKTALESAEKLLANSDESTPQAVILCVKHAVQTLETEIEFSLKQMEILKDEDLSVTEKLTKIVELNEERGATPDTKQAESLAELQKLAFK